MSFADALKEAGAKAAGTRPYFLDSQVERVLAITMTIAQELAVARQRLDTLERLLAAKGVVAQDEVEGFAPDSRASVERAMWNQDYIARILRIVQQENEAAALAGEVASGDVADEVAGES